MLKQKKIFFQPLPFLRPATCISQVTCWKTCYPSPIDAAPMFPSSYICFQLTSRFHGNFLLKIHLDRGNVDLKTFQHISGTSHHHFLRLCKCYCANKIIQTIHWARTKKSLAEGYSTRIHNGEGYFMWNTFQ